VQVGAFRDQKRAAEVAQRLRAAGFTVEESVLQRGASGAGATTLPPPVAEERFDVFVSGATVADVTAKLEGKTVSASAVAGGVVVTPSLPRSEAEALSRELEKSGWRISVRRASDWTETRKPEAGPAREETLHRVRVGSFPDRAAAEAARRALKAQGYASFVAREP
jgi:hypothetical protein